LNHASALRREQWLVEIASHGPDGVVISGDISEGDDVAFLLTWMARVLAVPIYFVLGNHDFYQASIAATRQRVVHAAGEHGWLHYLTNQSAIELQPGVFLLGEDGWGDATEGDYESSPVRLNDFRLIEDFWQSDCSRWKGLLQRLGAESAARLEAKLEAIPASAQQVIVITHVPPFREACWYQGHTTDDSWAPFFVCGSVGRVLQRHAAARPQCRLTVLCGHTHNAGSAQPGANLVVYTGAADYGQPQVEALLTVGPGTLVLASAR
jgi:predicted phosphohydrolase